MENAQAIRSYSDHGLIFIFVFACAIFFASLVFVPPLISLLIVVVGTALLLAEKIQSGEIGKEIALIAVVLIAFGLGGLRYAAKDFHELKMPLPSGIVVSEPEDKENSRSFVFKSDNGEKVLVSTPLYSPVRYGDRVEVRGAFERPGVIESESGGRDFDYGKYLAKDDIYYTSSFAEITIVESGRGNPLRAALYRLKGDFVEHTKKIMAEPYASLLAGLIVSGREALPAGILEEFRRAGVIHIVVLSGYNITLIAEFLRRMLERFFLFAKLPVVPQAAAAASIAGIVLFVLMTGAQATVVRAALMAIIVIGAKLFGRSYSAARALVFAAFIMLLENPKILVFDPSFQLSFLATLGLIYVMPPLEKVFSFITKKAQLRETLSQTIATQLAVLPLLIYSVGDVSLVSLPANLLILLVIPATMFLGFAATLVSYASPILAWPIAYVSYLLLSWILFVAHTLGTLSFAVIKIPAVSIWLVFLYYAILFFFVSSWSRSQESLPLSAN